MREYDRSGEIIQIKEQKKKKNWKIVRNGCLQAGIRKCNLFITRIPEGGVGWRKKNTWNIIQKISKFDHSNPQILEVQ
jgi:hypothetical protein